MKTERYIDTINHEVLEKRIFYYDSGKVSEEHYYLNGNRHRIDGPAIVNYYENGKVEKEIYFLNSKWHREDGPVFIWYDENGNIEEENYFLNDRKCDVLQEMAMRELNNLYQNSEPFTNRREISNKKIIQEEPIQEEIENKNVIKTKKRKIFIMENF